ncbi:hypothetical protein LNKW23_41510 [Paralimibaculum aggregatum]|uniref:Uncharacterized protein n=2 Tax=Paralimibaculum aggregatum TaxID=3036245 RepID=A0ABQ6LQL9_9RHOB|nr:hypothetical protein LNKW23_41510 [Limibaculum sp. NKW23]
MILAGGQMLAIDVSRLRAEAEEEAARLDGRNADAIRASAAMAHLVGCFCPAQARRNAGCVRTLCEAGGGQAQSPGTDPAPGAGRARPLRPSRPA